MMWERRAARLDACRPAFERSRCSDEQELEVGKSSA